MKRFRWILAALFLFGLAGCPTVEKKPKKPKGSPLLGAPGDLVFNVVLESEIEALWEEVQGPQGGNGGDQPIQTGN